MSLKIIAFDTSYIRRHCKDIKEKYPNDKYIICISETVDLEIKNVKEDYGHIYHTLGDQLEDFSVLLSRGRIYDEEIYSYTNQIPLPYSFPLWPEQIQEQRRNLLRIPNEKINHRIDLMRVAATEFWDQIRIGEIISISKEYLINSLENFLISNTILTSENSNISDLYLNDRENFMRSCPSSYYYLLLLGLLDLIRKPADAKKQFTLLLNQKQVKFTLTYITDLIIVLPFLPYIEEFITCDRAQANIIKFIANDIDSLKIKFFP